MWDREAGEYMVKAVFAEANTVSQSASTKRLHNWEARFYSLPTPMLCATELLPIITIVRNQKNCRLYPPFPLSEKGQMSGLLNEIVVPEGAQKVERWVPIPPSAVKGLICEPGKTDANLYARGIRFDYEAGFPVANLFKELTEQLAQFTYQWWLRSAKPPFRGPSFMGAFLDTNYNIITDEQTKASGEVESPWHGIIQTQKPQGIEHILTSQVWLRCAGNLQAGIPAERGILSFLDAVADYMAYDDESCILNLTLCFEILGNKRLAKDTGKTASKNKYLLERTTLVSADMKAVMKKLISDRDNVAHGRAPYNATKNPDLLPQYLSATRSVMQSYLNSLKAGEFTELAAFKLA